MYNNYHCRQRVFTLWKTTHVIHGGILFSTNFYPYVLLTAVVLIFRSIALPTSHQHLFIIQLWQLLLLGNWVLKDTTCNCTYMYVDNSLSRPLSNGEISLACVHTLINIDLSEFSCLSSTAALSRQSVTKVLRLPEPWLVLTATNSKNAFSIEWFDYKENSQTLSIPLEFY